MNCILMAGGVPQVDDPLYAETRGEPKALLDVAGRPMAQWVLDALDAAPSVERIVVVGLDAAHGLVSRKVARWSPDAGGFLENMLAGIAGLRAVAPGAELALMCSVDIPLITAAMLEALLARCADPGVDLYYHIVPRAAMERRFPGSRRSYVRMREGAFAGADLHVVAPRIAALHRALWNDLLRTRKAALRQALRLGPGFFVRLVLHRLSLPEAERRVQKRFGLRVRVQTVPPEMGMDVDKPVQLALCRRELERC